MKYFINKNLITVENDEESVVSNSIIEEKSELMEESFDEENKEEFLEPTPRVRKKKEVDVREIMFDQMYSFEEFKKLFNSINKSVQFTSDSLEVIFDKYSLFKGEEKKVTLESIAAIVFKFEILAL